VTAQQLPGWRHVYSGKVRDLYASERDDDLVLVVASDRVSAYDHVLATPVPGKGAVLTALTLWWFERLAPVLDRLGVPHHVVSTDVPPAVRGRAMVCRRLEMVPVECVARGYLTGSGLADYLATGAVCGVELPPGLQDGSRLAAPVFTPATKAAHGEHDENVSFAAVADRVGPALAERLREVTLAVYAEAEGVARDRGVLLADTKLELGFDRRGGGEVLTLGDEVLTPDSSRFWPAEEWQPGRAQPSFDKQVVRDWLTSPASGWDRHGDEPPPPLPADVVARTRERYHEAYRRLTGRAWSGD
jgi:phosphoribosylaminoimidazole-succinocarboxamide synthase